MPRLNCDKCGDVHWESTYECGVIAERINWIATTNDLPDEGVTVLLFTEGEGEPVWPGYFDEATAHGYLWRTADGTQIEGVTYWAEMPAGPSRK